MLYKVFSFFIVLLYLTAFPLSSIYAQNIYPRPPWLDLQYSPQSAYHGVGWCRFNGSDPSFDEQELATNRALDNLCLKLSATVISEMKDVMNQRTEGGMPFTDEDVSSCLFVKTKQTLTGWQLSDSWTDFEKKVFWVLVIIDKKKADLQVKEQRFINEVVDGLKDEIRFVLKEQKKLAEQLNAQMEDRLREFLEKIREEELKNSNKRNEPYLPEPDPRGSSGLPEPIEVR
jgi:hypothetical protein